MNKREDTKENKFPNRKWIEKLSNEKLEKWVSVWKTKKFPSIGWKAKKFSSNIQSSANATDTYTKRVF